MKKSAVKLLTHEEVLEKLKQSVPPTECSQIETMRYAVQSLAGKPHAPAALKSPLLALKLTEFEAVQLLNAPPKTMLDLYVVVEELEERLSEPEIAAILSLLKAPGE